MGDRISIQFELNACDNEGKPCKERSVAFFDHWGGEDMVQNVHDFNEEVLLKRIANCNDRYGGELLDRMEPRTVMVAFIAWLFRGPEADSIPIHSFYLGVDANDGDNSDNGNVVFVLEPGRGIVDEYTERS